MRNYSPSLVALLVLVLLLLIDAAPAHGHFAADDEIRLTIIGRVINAQSIGIGEAELRVLVDGTPHTVVVAGKESKVAHTNSDGSFVVDLTVPKSMSDKVTLEVYKPGFRSFRYRFQRESIHLSGDPSYVRVPDIILPRILNPAFFLATAIFVVVFGLISLNALHETIAAFAGAAAMLGLTYFVGTSNPNYWIIGFHEAISFIDFDVIFLLMTMMIFMAVMSQTGVFQWLAFQTFRLARGNSFLVTTVLVIITSVVSSVLNDTTVMLLIAPVSIQIALAIGIHPAAVVVPEILASNIGGAATLIGTPPNTIIGSYVGLGFNQFLRNMLPISIIGTLILLVMTRWLYREEFDRERKPTPRALLSQLEASARITDRNLLHKSLILFGATLFLFFFGDNFNMPPAVVAILGSTALLLWVRPEMSEMLRQVDWTTLVFFMSLFMMVGGIQEVGLIQLIAEAVKETAGGSLLRATLLIIWVSAIASAVVANIPFTAAIIPVAVFLTQTIPGAENNVLYWALALGAGLGGNATYIGSAPNIVAMGIMDRAGYRLKFGEFSRIGVPVTFVTILVPMLWIIVRYFWLKF